MPINTRQCRLWNQKGTSEVLGGSQGRQNYAAIITVHIHETCMFKKFLQSLFQAVVFSFQF